MAEVSDLSNGNGRPGPNAKRSRAAKNKTRAKKSMAEAKTNNAVMSKRQRALYAAIMLFAFCAGSLYQIIYSTNNIWFNISDTYDDMQYLLERQTSSSATTSATSHEPYVNRWHHKFSSSSGYVFFKHIRKAGGTAIRDYIFLAMKHHGFGTWKQFLESTNPREVKRHFPFLDDQLRNITRKYYKSRNDKQGSKIPIHPRKHRVHYMEQEFSSMDWQCKNVDPRWNNSLNVIVLRHPIERHFSEYFYSGPPAKGEFDGVQFGIRIKGNGTKLDKNNNLKIDRSKLYINKTYTHALSMYIQEHLQDWAQSGADGTNLKWFFGHHYTDNFQLRTLSGCSGGRCLQEKNITQGNLRSINKFHPSNSNNGTIGKSIDSVCTMHPFYPSQGKDKCNKNHETCKRGCDGPCFYPASASGPVDETDLARAIHALEGFDIILLTETLDNEDQKALLADVMGIPRNTRLATGKRKANINTQKKDEREKTHYYRDLISNLTYPHFVDSFIAENRLEIELYDHAVRLNKEVTDQWKREVGWDDDGDDDDDDADDDEDTDDHDDLE